MQKWEYQQCVGADAEYLNKMGNKGWELVGLTCTLYNTYVYIFKRPLDNK